jgi:hypothetical protein
VKAKKERKEIIKFDRKLGKKQFFLADLSSVGQDDSYRDKIDKCFKMRIERLTK